MHLILPSYFSQVYIFLIFTLVMIGLYSCSFTDNTHPSMGDDVIESLIEDRKQIISHYLPSTPLAANTLKIDRNSNESNTSNTIPLPLMLAQKQPWLSQPNLTTRVHLILRKVPIQSFASAISRLLKCNVLVDSTLDTMLSANIEDLPWTSALDAIAQTHGFNYTYSQRTNLLRIFPLHSNISMANKNLLLSSGKEIIKVFPIIHKDPEALAKTLRSIFVQGDKNTASIHLIPNTQSREIIARGDPTSVRFIEEILQKIDRQSSQLLIHAFVIEVSTDFAKNLGIRIGKNLTAENLSVLGNTGLSINLVAPEATTGLGLLNLRRLKVELTALERQGKTKIVSTPQIFVLDQQEAVIFQGQEIPYQTVSENGTQTEFKEAGLRLAVTPKILNDNNILLALKINQDSVDIRLSNPPITRRELKTHLIIKSGMILVIGGIRLQSNTKAKDEVPILRNLPIIGPWLSRKSNSTGTRELLIFIAPRIVS